VYSGVSHLVGCTCLTTTYQTHADLDNAKQDTLKKEDNRTMTINEMLSKPSTP